MFYNNKFFSQTPIGVGNQTSTFTSMIRGITLLLLLVLQSVVYIFLMMQVLAFKELGGEVYGGAPPAYPEPQISSTQIFSQSNVVANTMISCNIQINAGEIIGVYGARGGNCTNSYGVANHVTSINGILSRLQRSGMQSCPANGPMANIWSEVNYKIGRIIMYTNCCNTAPNISVSSTSVTICQGDSTTLNASSNTSGGTYSWSNGATTFPIMYLLHQPLHILVTYSVPGCPPAQDSVVVNITPGLVLLLQMLLF